LAVTVAATVSVATVVDRNHGSDDSETPPTATNPTPMTGDTNSGDTPDTGAAIFADNCARCHGNDGGGGVGPQLSAGRVVTHYPNVDDQIAFVTSLHSNITDPANLSAENIRAVVEYTRGL
jgi:mono/diheme cytochrome c family protein